MSYQSMMGLSTKSYTQSLLDQEEDQIYRMKTAGQLFLHILSHFPFLYIVSLEDFTS